VLIATVTTWFLWGMVAQMGGCIVRFGAGVSPASSAFVVLRLPRAIVSLLFRWDRRQGRIDALTQLPQHGMEELQEVCAIAPKSDHNVDHGEDVAEVWVYSNKGP
jgi:hypothetical protein